MKEPLHCPFCESPMVVRFAIPDSCVSAPDRCKVVSVKCERGCIEKRQYSNAKKAIEHGMRLVYQNKRIIKKAIETPKPLFCQEAY